MTLSEDVFAALSSGSPPSRVYPDVLPQMAILPALVFSLVGGRDDFHLGGESGLLIRLVQVDAWAKTRLSAESLIAIATAEMIASQAFQVNAVDISAVDGYEPETERYRASREFAVWIQA